MPLKTSGDVVKRCAAMEKTLTGRDMAARFKTLGPSLVAAGENAVGGAMGGDRKYSGWPGPDPLALRATLHRGGGGITIGRTRGSAGPWRVSDTGRNQGNAAGFSGPGINTRTGVTSRTKAGNIRKVRARKAKRWNGRTRGEGTWDKAAAGISRIGSAQFAKITRKAVADAFTKGT